MRRLMRGVPLLAILAIVVGGLQACGDDDGSGASTPAPETGATAVEKKKEKTTAREAPTLPTIVIRDGEPVGGVAELEYDAGDQIRFRVSSNRPDEVHVHGYDVEEEIFAGRTVALSFPAEIEGIFEVELHESEAQIAELRVNP